MCLCRMCAVAQATLFVEQELSEKFPRLMSFVKDTESLIASLVAAAQRARRQSLGGGGGGAAAAPPAAPVPASSAPAKEVEIDIASKIDAAAVESIVRQFAKGWREGVEQITASVNQSFTTAGDVATERVANDVLKMVLIQLVMYYKRFDDILNRCFANRPPAFMRDMLSVRALMFEVQKFASRS